MRVMGLAALYPKPRVAHPEHRGYPDRLRDLAIERPNPVGAADITYVPMARGFRYRVALLDWASRKVLAWRVSNSLDSRFGVEALQEALARYGKPEIFNTDPGSQFTSEAFTAVLPAPGIRISLDGRGRCHDNLFVGAAGEDGEVRVPASARLRGWHRVAPGTQDLVGVVQPAPPPSGLGVSDPG